MKATVWKRIGLCALCVCILACTALSTVTLVKLSAVEHNLVEYAGIVSDPGREDDVVIAENYTIRSTRAISDAYLSGDTEALSDRDKETLSMASKVLKQIIKKGMTTYQKEEAVYEWMLDSLKPDDGALVVIPTTEEDCDNPYGVLKYHNAVCVGFATTFRLFMQMLDIECMVVHESGLYHTWDLVKLDDGWYHTDIYSDQDGTRYANFNRTDADMEDCGNDWDRDLFPAAVSKTYSYPMQHRQIIPTLWDVPAALAKALRQKQTSLVLDFETPITPEQTLLAQTLVYSLESTICGIGKYEDRYFEFNWVAGDKGQSMLQCAMPLPEKEERLSKKELRQIVRAIKKAFGRCELMEESEYDDE